MTETGRFLLGDGQVSLIFPIEVEARNVGKKGEARNAEEYLGGVVWLLVRGCSGILESRDARRSLRAWAKSGGGRGLRDARVAGVGEGDPGRTGEQADAVSWERVRAGGAVVRALRISFAVSNTLLDGFRGQDV